MTPKEQLQDQRDNRSDTIFEQMIEAVSRSWKQHYDVMMQQFERTGRLKITMTTCVAEKEQTTTFRWENKELTDQGVSAATVYNAPASKVAYEPTQGKFIYAIEPSGGGAEPINE